MTKIPEKTAVGGIMLLSLLLGLLCIDSGHSLADDFAMYVHQAIAMTEGRMFELYEQNRFAMDHSYGHMGPYLYPSGFPLLLVPVYACFGLNFVAMKVYCLLFFVGSLPLIYALFRSRPSTAPYALTITALVALNYHFIRFGDQVYSDLPFFFFLILALLLIQKNWFRNWRKAILLTLLIFFCYNIRDVGIFLFAPLIFAQYQYYQKQVKAWFLMASPYLFFVVLWLLRAAVTPPVGSDLYLMLLEITPELIWSNIYYYWLLAGNYFLVFRIVPSAIQWLSAGLFFILFLLGLYKNKFKEPLFLSFLLGVMALNFIWVSFQGMRFVFPVIPFFLFYVIKGIELLVVWKKVRSLILGALIMSVFAQSILVTKFYWQNNSNEVCSEDLQQIYQYIKEELPEEAIITFQRPRTIHLFTRRLSVQKNIPEATFAISPTSDTLKQVLLRTETYTLHRRME